ncbi:hypothetical protein [Tessaracoccus caeni]|uniref:hypothetical protein n=1 Tax=Tessaracoccus caeni TaxID=3031239 RepID=UPI0023DC6AB9|nr:hypothetical protein [Tessaracoccus caeni]MDF1488740.1 hypothetical protein [Tessaracoccus caeni]
MTATTVPQPSVVSLPATRSARLTFGGVVRSEWIKALSLRSIRWSVIVSIGLGVAMSAAIAFALNAMAADAPAESHVGFLTTVTSFPAGFLSLVFGVLGVFLFSSEYASGMILSTLTSAPRRGLVFAAKAVVLTVLSVFVAVVVLASGIGASAIVLPASTGSILDPQALTGFLGTLVFLLVVALFAFAAAGILRSTAGGITVMVAVVFLLPTILQIVTQVSDWSWAPVMLNYLPSTLGTVVGAGVVEGGMGSDLGMPGYGTALVALAAWALIPMGAAAWLFSSRDAK